MEIPRLPIQPYSPGDWQLEWDAGQKLHCPRCGSEDEFGPRQAVLADRTFRRYRGCKQCGLFQEADGQSAPYQTALLAHDCRGNVGADAQCRGCGLRIRSGGRHLCTRIVRAGEAFTCPECGTALSEQHRRPWPQQGPWGDAVQHHPAQ
jgi:transcription elongation factor Elf1